MNAKLRTKFMCILIPAVLLAACVILAFSSAVSRRYDRQLYQSTSQLLGMAVDNIEKELLLIESEMLKLSREPRVQAAFGNGVGNIRNRVATVHYNETASEVHALINNLYSDNPYVSSAAFCIDDEILYAGSGPSYSKQLENMRYYASLHGEQPGGVWHGEEGLVCTMPIWELTNLTMQYLGMVVVEVDLPAIVSKNLDQSPNLQYAPMLVIKEAESPVYSNASASLQELAVATENSYGIVSAGGKKYFVTYAAESQVGWQYAAYLSFHDVSGSVRRLRIASVLVTGMTILAVIWLGQSMVSHIVVDLNRLVEKMQVFRTGEFTVHNAYHYGERRDELAFIHVTFDHMVEDMKRLVDDNYVKQLLIRDATLKSLQQQVNPHFLFNTLQTITWTANSRGQKEISRISAALGKLLRYTLKEDGDTMPLKKELQITQSYIAIQKSRYGERLEVSIDIPTALYVQQIPKLSLQNVVENAIKYALEAVPGLCVVSIWAYTQGADFYLCVEDNGPGIDEKLLQTKPAEQAEGGPVSGLGIGLKNIQQRIQILFSTKYGLALENTGHGARVTFHLPNTANAPVPLPEES